MAASRVAAKLSAMAATACSPISVSRENATQISVRPSAVCDSVLDWRVGPRLCTAFDPPNFPQPVQPSKLSLIGPQPGPVKISEEIVDM